jgi:hypothetical protein
VPRNGARPLGEEVVQLREGEIPESDAQEQGDPDRVRQDEEPDEIPQEVPEGDALEQEQ